MSGTAETPPASTVIVKKPSIILLDISGTLAKKSFMGYSNESINFVKHHIREFMAECYPKVKELRLTFNFMKLQEKQDKDNNKVDKNCPKLAEVHDKREKRAESIINWVLYKIRHEADAIQTIPAIALFQLHMMQWGYERRLLKTPLYEDVVPALKNWNEDKLSVFVTIASDKFADMITKRTTGGDIKRYISGHVNLMQFKDGKFVKEFEGLNVIFHMDPSNVLFITRITEDARQAKKAGIASVLILRDDFESEMDKKVEEVQKIKEKAQTKDSKDAQKKDSKETQKKDSKETQKKAPNEAQNGDRKEAQKDDPKEAKKETEATASLVVDSNLSLSSLELVNTIASNSSSLGETASAEDSGALENIMTSSTIDVKSLLEFPLIFNLTDLKFT